VLFKYLLLLCLVDADAGAGKTFHYFLLLLISVRPQLSLTISTDFLLDLKAPRTRAFNIIN